MNAPLTTHRSPAGRLLGKALVIGCLVAGSVSPATAHPHTSPPPIDVKLHILDDVFKVTIVVQKQLWREVAPVPEGGVLWDEQRMAQWFAKACEVRVDDKVIPFVGHSMKRLIQLLSDTGKASPPSAIATLRAPRSGPLPKVLTIEWRAFDHIMWEGKVEVPVIIERGLMSGDAGLLTPEEPGLAWHSAAHIERPKRDLEVVGEAAPRPRKRGWMFPLYAALAALAGLILALLLRKPAVRVAALALGIGGAVLLGQTGSMEIGGESAAQMQDARALEIFEKLHRNIYTAFEVEKEDEIFDRLSVSAKGKVLEDLYGEVFESLVLRDEAGAVASVESVETTGRKITLDPSKPGEFVARWSWNMIGRVLHWGHMHRRKNIYEAEYVVRQFGDAWYIVDIKVLERARESLDPPVAVPGDGGPPPDGLIQPPETPK